MKGAAGRPSVAVVGGESLAGRELRDVIASAGLDASLKLVGDAQDTERVPTEQDDDLEPIGPLEEESLRDARVVFLAGSRSSSRKAQSMAGSPGPLLVDLSFGLEDSPQARIRAPLTGEDAAAESPLHGVHVVAHPVSIVLALFLERLHDRYPIRRAVATILEPASERGRRGLTELQQQTVGLLSFKSFPKAVFDEQLSFNLLARYGDLAPEPLEEVEQRIDRHLAALLARRARAPMPSLRLIQAPVFHGSSISLWAELEQNPGAQALAEALASAQIDVRGRGEAPPTNVGAAGQSGLSVGAIEVDRNHAQAAWFWIVADNLRLAADNAVAIARAALEAAQ